MQRREAFSSAATAKVATASRRCLFLLCAVLAGAATSGALTACGPIEYVNQVTRKASSEVEAAKAVKADKHAPYWYTLAVEYLHKAREEAAAADFQSANLFGRRSAKAARKARSVAIEQARNPDAKPPEMAPAEDDEIEIVDPSSDEAIADEDDNPLADEDDNPLAGEDEETP